MATLYDCICLSFVDALANMNQQYFFSILIFDIDVSSLRFNVNKFLF